LAGKTGMKSSIAITYFWYNQERVRIWQRFAEAQKLRLFGQISPLS
jgi:hypothetical protein